MIRIVSESTCEHVVFTGGEPMLQQGGVQMVLASSTEKFFEVETNGTIIPAIKPDLFTVSPKFPFKVDDRYFLWYPRTKVVFKFVVDQEGDLGQIDRFVQAHKLTDVFLMPQATTLREHRKKLPMLFEWVKVHHEYVITPRLQILAYGKRKGV
jgi:organic radical activating enzyme